MIPVNGHDMEALSAAFAQAKDCKGVPTMLLAKTVKGKGVSFMENQAGWHGKAPNAEQYEQARQELVAALAEKDVVIVGHLEERTDPRLQVTHDLRNLRSPVAGLENRKAESLIVEELRLDPREHRFRQHRRTGSEIERSFHGNPLQTQARQKDRA